MGNRLRQHAHVRPTVILSFGTFNFKEHWGNNTTFNQFVSDVQCDVTLHILL